MSRVTAERSRRGLLWFLCFCISCLCWDCTLLRRPLPFHVPAVYSCLCAITKTHKRGYTHDSQTNRHKNTHTHTPINTGRIRALSWHRETERGRVKCVFLGSFVVGSFLVRRSHRKTVCNRHTKALCGDVLMIWAHGQSRHAVPLVHTLKHSVSTTSNDTSIKYDLYRQINVWWCHVPLLMCDHRPHPHPLPPSLFGHSHLAVVQKHAVHLLDGTIGGILCLKVHKRVSFGSIFITHHLSKKWKDLLSHFYVTCLMQSLGCFANCPSLEHVYKNKILVTLWAKGSNGLKRNEVMFTFLHVCTCWIPSWNVQHGGILPWATTTPYCSTSSLLPPTLDPSVLEKSTTPCRTRCFQRQRKCHTGPCCQWTCPGFWWKHFRLQISWVKGLSVTTWFWWASLWPRQSSWCPMLSQLFE